MWAAPSMVLILYHSGCSPHVRLNDWLGATQRDAKSVGESADSLLEWLASVGL